MIAKIKRSKSCKFFVTCRGGSGPICSPFVLMLLSSRSPCWLDSWLWCPSFPFWSLSFPKGGKSRNLQVRRTFSINIMFFIAEFSCVSYSRIPDSAVLRVDHWGVYLGFLPPITMYYTRELNVCGLAQLLHYNLLTQSLQFLISNFGISI